ncbi:hypothetical protein EYF80_014550 [Liparis tanakae]|uniref:Uncharacterized protein n=1 Tax=Liparis tanakae TaxID=230148 RepID=A0A4Z2IB69_9TELE|nr:hypothetical protein EYF80_014550 [Liparis tanakae]
METSTIHQADGGREEEWAESQQGHGRVGLKMENSEQTFMDLATAICKKGAHCALCDAAASQSPVDMKPKQLSHIPSADPHLLLTSPSPAPTWEDYTGHAHTTSKQRGLSEAETVISVMSLECRMIG